MPTDRGGSPRGHDRLSALEVGAHFTGGDVARVLTRVGIERGLPAVINCDNGTEFTSKVLDQWAWGHGVQLDFSRPGKPTDNATIEAFNAASGVSAFRNITFSTLAEAAVVLAAYAPSTTTTGPIAA